MGLEGKRFGKLVVVERLGMIGDKCKAGRESHFRCLCDCGNENNVRYSNLKSGNTKSCGCGQPRPKIQVGHKHGIWTVVKIDEIDTSRFFTLECICGYQKIVKYLVCNQKNKKCQNCAPTQKHNYRARLIGQKFNQLTILSLEDTPKHVKQTAKYIKCICDCGKVCIIAQNNVINGKQKSCGCLLQQYRERLKQGGFTRKGPRSY